MKKLLFAAAALLAVVLAATAYLSLKGSMVVYDTAGNVVLAAVKVGGDERQFLHRAGNTYFGIQSEGVLEVHCKDGSKLSVGYVTHPVQIRAKVNGCHSAEFNEWIGFPWGPSPL